MTDFTNKRPAIELLAPAGDMEKLKTAVYYGADAVYFGGEMFSLRAGAGNLSVPEIREAMDFLHARGARGYMTINIYPHNEHLNLLRNYLMEIKDIPVDAFLVSDPGVMTILKEIIPDAEIHLSTQANTTNYMTARFWASMGVKRIVTAREMSLKEIREMRDQLPDEVEIESFVHGAMCISYSGRCLMSNFMTGRDANMGACTHPCRWKYSIVEEKRPGEYYPIEEDSHGSYIMNSRDLCMLDGIPDLAAAGVSSLKIEGRMKSAYYVATVVSAYRTALDHYLADPDNYQYDPAWFTELCKASHREFTHGFYYNKPSAEDQNYQSSDYIREYSFVGMVKGVEPETGFALVEQRNKFSIGDEIEIFGPGVPFTKEVITEMYNQEGEPVESAPHPQQIIKLKLSTPVKENYILRMKKQL
ncbi:peptidase U32 family protein [Baileyella intestinalis]|uniref:peptidase U32 family protein n=1 Tax=Baileyella intestinalis TaxID=2606709 RepID=UPI0022E4294F|nr:U32 family peptidase [Baileyella intestinalis]MCI7686301.1 U32 family peptidase [Clostridiales bacterium]MDY2995518.1 U32 family peptidase [Baileyella intestinalis]